MTQTIYTFARYQYKTSFNKKDYECLWVDRKV